MRNLGLVFVTGLALVGCGSNSGDDNNTDGGGVTATASGVFPANGFAGRSLRVEVTGDATDWSSTTTLAFGTGVTVSNISVASPTDLFADLAIDPTAMPGLQDVTVTDGGSTFKLSQAFEIDAPATIATSGLIAQGSISEFTITNVDVAHPFDTTTAQDAGGNTIYPNIAFTAPAGVGIEIEQVTDFGMTGLFLTDIDAASGTAAIGVASGPAGGTIVMTPAGSINVMARTAMALTSGTAMTGTVANGFDSQLYSFTPGTTVPDVEALTLTTASADAGPAVAVLPASGHFSDLISFGAVDDVLNTTAGTLQYLVYWDNSGTSGYNFSIREDDTVLTHSANLTANESAAATAGALTLPSLANNGDAATSTGEQWMKFALAAGDVGKEVRVITTGDVSSDVEVVIYASLADATGGTNALNDCYTGSTVDCVTPATTAAGTYYVDVIGDPFSTTDYTGIVYLQTAN